MRKKITRLCVIEKRKKNITYSHKRGDFTTVDSEKGIVEVFTVIKGFVFYASQLTQISML